MEIGGKQVVFAQGSHSPDEGEGCAMEWTLVAWLVQNGWDMNEAWEMLDDTPKCTAGVIAYVVQNANDVLDDIERQRLVPFISRLIYAHAPKDEDVYAQMEQELKRWLVEKYPRVKNYPVSYAASASYLASILFEELALAGEYDEIIDIVDDILTKWEKMLVKNDALLDEPEVPEKPISSDDWFAMQSELDEEFVEEVF